MNCRQRERVVKSAVIMIDTFAVQNLLAPFCFVRGKDTLRRFLLIGGLLKAIINFDHISLKLKN